MYIKLPETPSKFETIIDSREVLCFNEKAITFKNGYHLDSCEEWHKALLDVTNRLNQVFEKLEGAL